MKILRLRQALLFFMCFILVSMGLPAQEASPQESSPQGENETASKYNPREQNLLIDIPLTIAEITAINLLGNIYWRLWGPDSESAYFTLDSIRTNLKPSSWSWEEGLGGDTFLVNQMFHPFAGAYYFASARSNNLNYYVSALAPVLGSLQWETFAESQMPGTNDFITTVTGGIVIGEILHRLFLELDKCGTGGRIGASFVSPTDRLTAAIRGYGPGEGPNRIRRSSLALGASWLYARFYETNDDTISWNRPALFFDFDLVYDDPFTAHSKTPFDQFDLNISLALAIPQIYNLNFISEGYMASWLLADDDDEVNQASHGITLNFDCYVTDKGFMDLNNGRENLSFTASSLDYAIKWRHVLNSSLEFSLKSSLGISPWSVATYNGGVNKDDYNLFSFGGNAKLLLELRQIMEGSKKAGQVLGLGFRFYDTWSLYKTPSFDANTFFLSSSINYSFPLTERLSLYIADNFMLLHCDPINDAAAVFPDITRFYNNAEVGVKITFM